MKGRLPWFVILLWLRIKYEIVQVFHQRSPVISILTRSSSIWLLCKINIRRKAGHGQNGDHGPTLC